MVKLINSSQTHFTEHSFKTLSHQFKYDRQYFIPFIIFNSGDSYNKSYLCFRTIENYQSKLGSQSKFRFVRISENSEILNGSQKLR